MLGIFLHQKEHCMYLDITARDALDRIKNVQNVVVITLEAANTSLIAVVYRKMPLSGKRYLRHALMEPWAFLETIESRQDITEGLINSESLYFAMVTVLKTFPDLERSIAYLIMRRECGGSSFPQIIPRGDVLICDEQNDSQGNWSYRGDRDILLRSFRSTYSHGNWIVCNDVSCSPFKPYGGNSRSVSQKLQFARQ